MTQKLWQSLFRMKNKLPITEELDFHYLLTLLPPLQNEPEFALLPELFSTITSDKPDFEKLIDLCKFCGGEVIKIPTIDQLSDSISALQYFYDVDIKGMCRTDIVSPTVEKLYHKIRKIYAQHS